MASREEDSHCQYFHHALLLYQEKARLPLILQLISDCAVACLGHLIRNDRRMAVTRKSFKIFLSFFFFFRVGGGGGGPNIVVITIQEPSLINYFRAKGAFEFVFVAEKRLDPASV